MGSVHPGAALPIAVGCPPADVLAAFAAGELVADEIDALEQHLGECADCLATVACLGHDSPERDAPMASGTVVGRHRVLQCVGRGSFGVVYAAYDPELDRKIALKVLDRAHGREMRFLDEVRAMAKVSDPHVVAIFDVGRAHDHPYIAMEFVDGPTLRDWLAAEHRSTDAIVGAYAQAGTGLAAAHAAGVIHRDFKPDNVLVRPNGSLAVSDFGLADLDGRTVEAHALAGTPLYMAPEALRGNAVDARADVFAFCVALYEALFGVHPFPAQTLDELAQAIKRGTRPPREGRVPRHVRDAVLSGLAAEPADRPAMTALLRALEHDPRRRRWQIAVLAIAALGVVGALTLGRDHQAASCATQANERAAEVWSANRRAAVRAALERTTGVLGRDTASRVELVLDRYASSWRAAWIGACDASAGTDRLRQRRLDCLERRRERWTALVASLEHPDSRAVINASTATYALPAVELCGEQRWLASSPDDPSDARFAAAHAAIANAQVLADLGHTSEGLAAIAPPLAFAREIADPALEAEARLVEGDLRRAIDPPAAEAPLHAAAIAASAAARLDLETAAKVLLVQTLAHSQLRFGEVQIAAEYARALVGRLGDPSMAADYAYARGLAEWSIGGVERSLPFDLVTLVLQRLVHGEEHPKTAEAENNLAVTYFELERLPESIALEERAIATRERLQGPEHPEALNAKGNLAFTLAELGQIDKALALQEAVAAGRERVFGPDYFLLSETWVRLSRLYQWELGRTDDALRAARRARAIDAHEFGDDASEGIASLANLARILAARGELAEADEASTRALAIADKQLPEGHSLARAAMLARGLVLERAGRCTDALAVLERLLRASTALDSGRAELATGLTALARCRAALGDAAAAETALRQAVALREQTRGVDSPMVAEPLVELAAFYRAHHHLADAARAAERAVRVREHTPGMILERARRELALSRRP